MSEAVYDAVIVGARCAGAPLATHLARGGMKVCLVDADRLPSDQPFSTHAIAMLGMHLLDELGVGDRVRAVTPGVRAARISVGGAALDLQIPAQPGMYAPRRSVLDPFLADVAVAAGAELRDETAVLDVLRDGERVTGVRVRNGGEEYDLRGRIVVGADGRNSTIAKKVKARAYHEANVARGGYWSYYPTTRDFEALPVQSYIEIDGNSACFAFRADSNLVISGALEPPAVAKGWTKDPAPHVAERLRRSPILRCLVEGNQPAAPFVGLLGARFFFREPIGPGWALVGDAALHKDPTPGYGITDALRDAKALAAALLDGRAIALEYYWRKRDVESIPFYENALAMGALDYDNPLNRLILRHASRSPSIQEKMLETVWRTRSPFDALSPLQLLGWVAGEFVRGKGAVWPHFVKAAKRGQRVAKELAYRKKLLAEVEARMEKGPRAAE